MNLEEAVAARRSVRRFQARPVPRAAVEAAVALAVRAPAPHHSAPWRFSLVESEDSKARLARKMAELWRADLTGDGYAPAKIDGILERSHRLLTTTPTLVVCSADMTRAHSYPDERRRLAEWSLFAHSVGAALQTFMLALAENGIASCWISAPVFCRSVVAETLGLPDGVEPHALVLVGYASEDYEPPSRPPVDLREFIIDG